MSVPDELLTTLRGLDAERPVGVPTGDWVIMLITLCIEEGCRSGRVIVRAIADLGYNLQFAGMMLNRNPDRFERDGDGGWCLRPPPTEA